MSEAKQKPAPTCKEAIAKWQAKTKENPTEATKVLLIAMFIKKMDSALNTLVNCEHLGLSSNCIDKIAPLPGLKRLKTLSLGRNQIRKIEKLEDCAGTLENLWLSYNQIEKLDGLSELRNLKVLYLGNNQIKSFDELSKLRDLPKLEELLLVGNPIYSANPNMTTAQIRAEVLKRVPKLSRLDGTVIVDSDSAGDA